MVGPSSSHTAGAVRMGYVAGKLLGEPIQKAEILLYGSFLATGEGHGTRKAIVAGLLGMQTDYCRIRMRLFQPGFPECYFHASLCGNLITIRNLVIICLHSQQTCHNSFSCSMLAKKNVNIATMQVYRSAKGQQAVMVVECDQLIPEDGIVWLAGVEGVQKVTYFPGLTA